MEKRELDEIGAFPPREWKPDKLFYPKSIEIWNAWKVFDSYEAFDVGTAFGLDAKAMRGGDEDAPVDSNREILQFMVDAVTQRLTTEWVKYDALVALSQEPDWATPGLTKTRMRGIVNQRDVQNSDRQFHRDEFMLAFNVKPG